MRNTAYTLMVGLVLGVAILHGTAAHAETANEIRQEMYRLAEKWDANQGIIIGYLTDPDPIRRKYAVEVIPLSDAKPAALKVVPLISDPDREVRYKAINRFIDWTLEEAIPRLADSLRSGDEKIKKLAVGALVHQGQPSAFRALEDFIDQTQDINMLESVLEALGSITYGNPEINSIKTGIEEMVKLKLNDLK